MWLDKDSVSVRKSSGDMEHSVDRQTLMAFFP